MFPTNYLLFNILMLLGLGAVIAFCYLIIKPMQTHWAIITARKIVAEGEVKSRWQFRNAYRMLATARNDLEAAKLWRQLDEIREKAGQPTG